MRKKPDIQLRQCKNCGRMYKPTGNSQMFCPDCREIISRKRKSEWYRKANPNAKFKQKCMEECSVCGGEFSCHFDGKPYCNKHYQKMRVYGNPDGKPRKSTNLFKTEGSVLSITTKKGDVILADAEDREKLEKYSWCISKTGYAVANIGKKVVKMHRFILGVTDTQKVVDHKNNNTHDNRKCNLRICTAKENSMNQSGNKGRTLPVGIRQTPNGKYTARIMVDRKMIHIGTYSTLNEAVFAREQAENKYNGEFANHKN